MYLAHLEHVPIVHTTSESELGLEQFFVSVNFMKLEDVAQLFNIESLNMALGTYNPDIDDPGSTMRSSTVSFPAGLLTLADVRVMVVSVSTRAFTLEAGSHPRSRRFTGFRRRRPLGRLVPSDYRSK